MIERHSVLKRLPVRLLCCCLLLSAALAGCQNSANTGSTDNRSTSGSSGTQDSSGSTTRGTSDDASAPATQRPSGRNAELCQKVDACGCQSYDKCMALFENDPNIDQPGVRECMLKSSCQSLCAGKPDGCPGTGGTSAGNPAAGPQKSNCSAISCSKNSDCPSDCYGGCDGVICYSF